MFQSRNQAFSPLKGGGDQRHRLRVGVSIPQSGVFPFKDQAIEARSIRTMGVSIPQSGVFPFKGLPL